MRLVSMDAASGKLSERHPARSATPCREARERGGRSHVDDIPCPVYDADLSRAERSGGFDKTAHHQLVDFEEVFHLAGGDAS